MGFWDSLGKAAKSGMNAMQEFNAEANNYYERYRNYDREELIRKFKSSSNSAEKGAIAKIMKENGWSALMALHYTSSK